jgi:hypothetical protein
MIGKGFMNISSKKIGKFTKDLEKLIGFKIYSIIRISPSGNSLSYKVETEENTLFVKDYYKNPKDQRNRLKTEFQALKFLWEKGIRNIPKPYFSDEKNNIGIYEYIKGKEIRNREIGYREMQKVLDFIIKLKGISRKYGNEWKQPASEACFSTKELLSNIEYRYRNLRKVRGNNDFGKLLKKFWNLFSKYKLASGNWKLATDIILSTKYRILSPSDFGFHNAFRKDNGHFVFIDFEYFGWDDPVKLISDFLIHPKMELSVDMKKIFRDEAMKLFSDDQNIKQRFKILFPLFQLKWCLIMLNEFLPESLGRREFAAGKTLDREKVQKIQLEKVQKLLNQVESGYNIF